MEKILIVILEAYDFKSCEVHNIIIYTITGILSLLSLLEIVVIKRKQTN